MIIIDSQQELADFINSDVFDSIGMVKLDMDGLEVSHLPQDDLAFVHANIYTQKSPVIQSKLEQLNCLLLFDPSHKVEHFSDNTILVIDHKTDLKVLRNFIFSMEDMLKQKQVLRSQLMSVNQELSHILGDVETEMFRVKKMYETKTPRRFQDIKGVQVYSKYSAGENIGGEFFDIFMEQNKLFVLMSNTSSYLASSSILQLFTQFKKAKEISGQSELALLEQIKSEVQSLNQNKKKDINLELFTAIIDLNKHQVSGHLFGKFNILSSAANTYVSHNPKESVLKANLEDGAFSRTIERGERILLCSPGFNKNWERLKPDFIMEEIITQKKIKALDILDEIFFQLKKDISSGFLAHDASAIILEVQQNAMVEV